jgi:tRNA isopentenyl-2-thiomethyl-A-37 hydroxylase MiaE
VHEAELISTPEAALRFHSGIPVLAARA